MTLRKISRIQKYRVFDNFIWPSDMKVFTKYNMIYGWNGSGKTSLSSLLAHVQTLTPITDGDVAFVFDGPGGNSVAEITGRGLDKASELPPVRVFDRAFVDNTLLKTGGQLSPIYVVGKENVERSIEIEKLKTNLECEKTSINDGETRLRNASNELDALYRQNAKHIKDLMSAHGSEKHSGYNKNVYQNAVSRLDPQTYKESILDEKAIPARKKRASETDMGLNARLEPSGVNVHKLYQEAESLVRLDVVAQSLDELTKDKTVERWVHDGLALHTGEYHSTKCRFCGNEFGVERRKAVQAHFSDSFTATQKGLIAIKEKIQSAKSALNSVRLPEPRLFYSELRPEVENVTKAVENSKTTAVNSLDFLIAQVDHRLNNMFVPIDKLDGFPEANVDFDVEISSLNRLVDRHNKITDSFKADADEARSQLEAHFVAQSYEDYDKLRNAVNAANTGLKESKNRKNSIAKEIEELETQIANCSTAPEELTRDLSEYLGHGELKCEMAVEGTGYAITRGGHPVKNLSDGEKTAITFLYFLKSLEDKAFDINNGIVVIDDPVSSLDANSLFSASAFMRERTSDCGQLIILTHNFQFFSEVRNWFKLLNHQKKTKGSASMFMLKVCQSDEGTRSSRIEPLDPTLQECRSEYQFLFKQVYEAAKKNDSDVSSNYHMPNIARRLVEAFLTFRYPDKEENLRDLIWSTPCSETKKKQIYRLLNEYSHGYSAHDFHRDLTPLGETPNVMQAVLDLIKSEDTDHFTRMVNATIKQIDDTPQDSKQTSKRGKQRA